MNKQEIVKCCLAEREQLLQKHVGHLPEDRALMLEQISDRIDALETEYKHFLVGIWEQIRNNDNRSLEDILDKRYNRLVLSVEYAEGIRHSQSEAAEVTLWEQITHSNGRDIKALNALIQSYATDLLAHITLDFMEDV